MHGVSDYLDPESVDTLLELTRNSTHDGNCLAFDYTISISEENIINYFGVEEFTDAMKEHHSSEGLKFSIEEGKEKTFFEQRDIKIIDHLNNVEIERTYLTDKDGILIGQMTGHFRFVKVTRK